MYYYEVAPRQIVRLDKEVFTYSSETPLEAGTLVAVEVGKKTMTGVIMKSVDKPSYPTKPILHSVESAPLPLQLVQLATWIAEYYHTPLALVWQTILPRGLETKRRTKAVQIDIPQRDRTNIVFNSDQKKVLAKIDAAASGTFLLHGVTGSGKTEIYIELARRTVRSGKSVLVLVPEIALTSQVVAQFSHSFDTLLVVHSTMSEAERHITWQKALRSTEPLVIIGARSALFTPLAAIGLIIVDESHEPSYKQEQAPRYSALRTASVLGKLHKATVIFGSATPSIQDYYLAEQSGDSILTLPHPARKDTMAPKVILVDMTRRENFEGPRFLSKQLLQCINETLAEHKQVLIFHNRRGSAGSALCENCGWTAECPRCHIPLTLHSDQHALRCHICAHHEKIPTSCLVCQHADIIYKGFGTKAIETALKRLYPKANIARFDADVENDQTVNSRYSELYSGEIDILIGTQVVAKGLDLPHLRTVGVIQADSGLALPDFNASERTFQLLAQVVGRVGRNEHETNVVVQTYQPTHPSIEYGITQDYESFYDYTLTERQKTGFPPFTYLLQLTCVYKTEAQSIKAAKTLQKTLADAVHKDVTIFGPTPAFYERRHNTYRWQLVLKSPRREHLLDSLSFVPSTHWQSELDPSSLL